MQSTIKNSISPREMSRFFNYKNTKIAKTYDRLRNPNGVEAIAGLLHVHGNTQLKVRHNFFHH